MKSFKQLLFLSVILFCLVFFSSFSYARRISKNSAKTNILNKQGMIQACRNESKCNDHNTQISIRKNGNQYFCLCKVFSSLEDTNHSKVYFQVDPNNGTTKEAKTMTYNEFSQFSQI